MKGSYARILLSFIVGLMLSGCANIVAPTGGKKDVRPPRLLSTSPADSALNTRVSKLELHFNEFLNLYNASAEVQISPLLSTPLNIVVVGKKVTVKIPDSLLRNNTTYRISFGGAIRDLHEDNPFKDYTYTFSTGGYFDSLMLNGKVIDAATGLPDTGISIVLYDATKSDSAIVKEKPLYISRTSGDGSFTMKGLPGREFRIYALRDGNGNLVFDGGNEKIGFIDKIVSPTDSLSTPIILKSFVEKATVFDTVSDRKGGGIGKMRSTADAKTTNAAELRYSVGVDTGDIKKRTFDITTSIGVTFNKPFDTINAGRVNLSYDSANISVEAAIRVARDTVKPEVLIIGTEWKENTVYTLRLLKGFATDSAGAQPMPSKYIFRTKYDDDYAKLQVNLPSKYFDRKYILMIVHNNDTIYQKPVTDTVVKLKRLDPGPYAMRIIVDANGNGVWDTGDLLAKLQPEEVIPFTGDLQLKAKWENIVDFEPKKSIKGNSDKKPSLGMGDKTQKN